MRQLRRTLYLNAGLIPFLAGILWADLHLHVALWRTLVAAFLLGFQFGLGVWAVSLWQSRREFERWKAAALKRFEGHL